MNEKSDNRALLLDLRKENSKLKIEAQLRKSLSLQLEKQRQAIAKAKNPIQMAEAMKLAVISGRKSFLSGRINPNLLGAASTTNRGII